SERGEKAAYEFPHLVSRNGEFSFQVIVVDLVPKFTLIDFGLDIFYRTQYDVALPPSVVFFQLPYERNILRVDGVMVTALYRFAKVVYLALQTRKPFVKHLIRFPRPLIVEQQTIHCLVDLLPVRQHILFAIEKARVLRYRFGKRDQFFS